MIIKNFARLIIKLFFLGTFFVLAFSPCLMASDVTAKSCSAADIKAAIGACISSGGGTVTLPACSGGSNGSTWSNGDYIEVNSSVEFRLLGAGINSTVIQYSPGAGPPANTNVLTLKGVGVKEVGQFTLYGNDTTGSSILRIEACQYGMTNLRIHHFGARNIAQGMYICSNLNSVLLIDHCYIGDKIYAYAYGIRIMGNNNESTFVEPIRTMGTNLGVFIEDCEFNGTYHPIAGHGSAQYTVRHNTFSNYSAGLEGHGPSYQFGCIRPCPSAGNDAHCFQGVYRVEVYNNTFYYGGYATYPRSGHWIITDNTYIDNQAYDGPIRVEMENSSIGTNCNVSNNCPRAYGWAGVGSCNPPGSPGCWQPPQAIYVWNNTFINPKNPNCSTENNENCVQIVDKGTGCLRKNIEVFYRAPQAGDPEIRSYTKFPYPHPLVSSGPNQPSNPPPDPPENLRIIQP